MESIRNRSTANIVEELSTSEYHLWVGTLGYDTRPYCYRDGMLRYLPVAYSFDYVERSDGSNMPDLILADQPEIKNALVMLHKSGVQLIIPDYHGSTYCGEWTCFPAKMGWDCEYIPA